ncbi:signal peptide peptidase SppA [Actomonas aquatica]|uniref:Signal peptide peptidase SppA n=1 Tax=Actomonas aquatica TaxID=2866162 RepID=A0ABZ1CCR6_9BACT|nr:signal peptide peptidase SppA [Opitutus sp. WL0086]WRQ88095.1 signal peptide peptidase SppA [Opitutus sp. WL0086]
MKTFFASLLGTVTGLILFVIGGTLMMFIGLMVISKLGEPPKPQVEKGAYLVFDLSSNISDAPQEIDNNAIIAAFSGQDLPSQLQTRLVTRALRAAAKDDRIEGVLLKGSFAPAGYGTSFATLQEVRRALETFKEEGKPVQAFLQYPDTRDFYVASLADDIALDPQGMVLIPGLASQPTFYAGAFEKYGIGVQITRVGKYKSAVEPYTRGDFSPENREQLTSLLNSLWGELRDTVAEARDIKPADLQALIDAGEAFVPADALKAGLIDRLAYTDEILSELKEKTDVDDPKKPFKQVSLGEYIAQMGKVRAAPEEQPKDDGDEDGRVAVIYAEGAIVDGQGTPTDVGGAKFAREIRRLRQDPKVKAIVLRVNSPGGSAAASEHIQRELRLAAEKMPVVVSMGGYAASGGYWISAYGDRIFAEPTTITGSIGVFGMILNIEELGNSFGFTWDTVKTGEFADALSIARPKTDEEMALAQRVTDSIYADFIQKVAEGRDLDPDHVREIAQGRVWTGEQAIEIGLVDELGGLADAIAFAAKEADLESDFMVTEFPRPKELAEVIAEAMQRLSPTSVEAPSILEEAAQRLEADLGQLRQFNDPRGVYARLPVELIIQ